MSLCLVELLMKPQGIIEDIRSFLKGVRVRIKVKVKVRVRVRVRVKVKLRLGLGLALWLGIISKRRNGKPGQNKTSR